MTSSFCTPAAPSAHYITLILLWFPTPVQPWLVPSVAGCYPELSTWWVKLFFICNISYIFSSLDSKLFNKWKLRTGQSSFWEAKTFSLYSGGGGTALHSAQSGDFSHYSNFHFKSEKIPFQLNTASRGQQRATEGRSAGAGNQWLGHLPTTRHAGGVWRGLEAMVLQIISPTSAYLNGCWVEIVSSFYK